MRTTINTINLAISAAGSDFEIVRGGGYFYFVSDTYTLNDQSVYTNHLTSYTVDEWIDELQHKIDQTNLSRVEQIPCLNLSNAKDEQK